MEENSTVTQDYLKVVQAACEWGGAGAFVAGLARRMEVVPLIASESMARLVEEGLFVHEPYKAATLSEEGRRRAVSIIRYHRVLETYLVARLGFSWDGVYAEVEELEHAVSERLLERLGAVLGYPTRDPHGDPTPTADGRLIVPDLVGLEMLSVGSDGVIGRVQDDTETLRHLEWVDIGLDSRVRIRDRGTVASAVEGGGRRRATVAIPLGNDASRGITPAGASEAVIPDDSLRLLG